MTQNTLHKSKSPYLRQHAENPVHWQEWGSGALSQAKAENKPLLISIGYTACHWCHVMAHESFMNPMIADVMNQHFVCIKVDREERPDIDQIYMNAAQLLTGQGGWPLNAFALPDGRPFYAATYFPPKQWIQVLNQLADVYHTQHDKVVEQALNLTKGIQSTEVISSAPASQKTFTRDVYQKIFDNWKPIIDFEKGGFKGAPKFALPVGWEFLLQYGYLTKSNQATETVLNTLNKMARGGIYDHLGGGFARYSTDDEWFAPHFEKMLYDNGQLVSLYSHAYQVSHNVEYATIISETLDFIERELMDKNGGFYSSIDADSEGEEGKYYVWSHDELTQILDNEEARLLGAYFNCHITGNWEKGQNILHHTLSNSEFATKMHLSKEEWSTKLIDAKAKLLQARNNRKRPTTDDKILTSWNALMLKGYIDASVALENKKYLETAIKNARFLSCNMIKEDGSLWRNYKDGEAGIEAFLDDYALLIDAFLRLYEVTFDVEWLHTANTIANYTVDHFYDTKSGMFFYTSDTAEYLIARKMEINDNVIPSSNAIMATVLYKLGRLSELKEYLDMSADMLHHITDKIPEGGPYYAQWGILLGCFTNEPVEIAIMGTDADEKSQALQKHYLPQVIFMGGTDENLPLLKGKSKRNDTLIYVCRNKTCKQPSANIEDTLTQIE